MPFYFMSFLIHSSGYFKIFYSPFHCKWFAAFLFIFTTFTFCSQFQFSSAQSLSPGENFVQECCTSRPPFAVSSVRPLSSSGTAGFISFLFKTFFLESKLHYFAAKIGLKGTCWENTRWGFCKSFLNLAFSSWVARRWPARIWTSSWRCTSQRIWRERWVVF